MINLNDFRRMRQAINDLEKAFYNIEGMKILADEKGLSEEDTLVALGALFEYAKSTQKGFDEQLRRVEADLEAHSQHTELFSGEIIVPSEEEFSHDPLGLIAAEAIQDQA